MTTSSIYTQLTIELKSQEIGLTAAELHGFLSGILAGGNHDETWHILLSDIMNNGQPVTGQLSTLINALHTEIKHQLSESDFEFQLLLNDQTLYSQIDDLVGWVNHLLLGLGLVQPKIGKMKGDIGEAIYDLRQITQLGYDKNEDPEQLAFAFEEILEYVRMATILFHDEFCARIEPSKTLH
ncbi:UPF0149 family protein [Candidatus Schmidhempelia bombi]|jgi:uncharacterized protein|uniref:UPF0149 family protein n=1 Tax=Candidatus Schmidhempelia bombi str. Bimp TaxID=1387197 RepID=A0AB94ICD4_9GAMM|nr:UPF0149 family protein [Candidatus Schmidhempelia bombi]TEA27077.1 UPF0149 family protein [Candidatus Schmidhempelia bombi str. Bimp]